MSPGPKNQFCSAKQGVNSNRRTRDVVESVANAMDEWLNACPIPIDEETLLCVRLLMEKCLERESDQC